MSDSGITGKLSVKLVWSSLEGKTRGKEDLKKIKLGYEVYIEYLLPIVE